MPELVLISDFDGTITTTDFYELAVQELLTPEALAPWKDYRASKITHFTAMQRIFSSIRAPKEKVLAMLDHMGIDPHLAESVNALRNRGWKIVVASAGCLWYIDILLKKSGVSLEVHSNPGTYVQGGPLHIELPENDPFFCPEAGIDKAAIVSYHLKKNAVVAFAGDGYTDLPPALLVQPRLRFARSALADMLAQRGETFQPFEVWSDIARGLLAQGDIA
jgi:2,3-diketo-5-methylthio-1-phosphopentane phosphatase